MPKTAYILAAMLCLTLTYGQKITFHKNVNYRASALQQNLNAAGDVLLLESSTDSISKIEIFNEDYSESISVNSTNTSIDLKSLPTGNFVIQAKVNNQWIIMYLEKSDDVVLAHSDTKQKHKKPKTIEALLSQQKPKKVLGKDYVIYQKSKHKKVPETPVYYWVVYESNSSFGSSKTMRLEHKDDIEKLILKHKLELKSNVGKKNKLIVYEVYNKSAFMNKQFRDPKYYKSDEASKFLNSKPLYATNDETESDF